MPRLLGFMLIFVISIPRPAFLHQVLGQSQSGTGQNETKVHDNNATTTAVNHTTAKVENVTTVSLNVTEETGLQDTTTLTDTMLTDDGPTDVTTDLQIEEETTKAVEATQETKPTDKAEGSKDHTLIIVVGTVVPLVVLIGVLGSVCMIVRAKKSKSGAVETADGIGMAARGHPEDGRNKKIKEYRQRSMSNDYTSAPRGKTKPGNSKYSINNANGERALSTLKSLLARDGRQLISQYEDLQKEAENIVIPKTEDFTDHLDEKTSWQYTKIRVGDYLLSDAIFINDLRAIVRFLWTNNICFIVTLMNHAHTGQKTCMEYWLKKGDEMPCGNFRLCNKFEVNDPIKTLRTLEIFKESNRREIHHFQYMNWPPGSVPYDTESLSDFMIDVRQKINKHPNPGPILVHCSKDFQRTSVFLAMDQLCQDIIAEKPELETFQKALQFGTVMPGMLCSEEQYIYMHSLLSTFLESNISYELEPEGFDEVSLEEEENDISRPSTSNSSKQGPPQASKNAYNRHRAVYPGGQQSKTPEPHLKTSDDAPKPNKGHPPPPPMARNQRNKVLPTPDTGELSKAVRGPRNRALPQVLAAERYPSESEQEPRGRSASKLAAERYSFEKEPELRGRSASKHSAERYESDEETGRSSSKRASDQLYEDLTLDARKKHKAAMQKMMQEIRQH